MQPQPNSEGPPGLTPPSGRCRRRSGLKGAYGGVALEVALVLPVLCALVIGGWVLAYMAFAKVALTMTANRAARDFAAATELHGSLKDADRAYRYDGGFAESFGLPRWAVHALIMRTAVGGGKRESDQAVVVATCYRLPLTLPGGLLNGPREAEAAGLPDGSDLRELLERVEREYRNAWREVEAERDEWERLLSEGRALYERGRRLAGEAGWMGDLLRQAIEGPPPDLTPFDTAGAEGPDDLERAVRALCEAPEPLRGRSIIVTGRSAYLLQKVFEPQGRP
ncbi:hypothetical protein J2Z79_002599 [Symbiobacterium terraclitae]|uniref:TadE-like domain-containing protein n=1 Tax=Symbiobacterium terraclitae TaxID=557451 RepID=A0ABS4JUF1_9FIRM|nr:hypothetical protein [Symbiobacterium terraclitae]